MRVLRTLLCGAVLLAVSLIPACVESPTAVGANGGKYYAVSAERTPFYRYGPQQGNGPDKKLPRDTVFTVVNSSFGYSKVRLTNGEEGFVASEDIRLAPKELVVAATLGPQALAVNRNKRFHLNSNDPRLIAPPEPLPLDLPEPTPIPETQSPPP